MATPTKVTDYGTNVSAEVSADGNFLTLVIDLRQEHGPTGTYIKSGDVKDLKNLTVGKTNGGAVDVPGKPGHKAQVNVYRKATTAEVTKYAA